MTAIQSASSASVRQARSCFVIEPKCFSQALAADLRAIGSVMPNTQNALMAVSFSVGGEVWWVCRAAVRYGVDLPRCCEWSAG
ncbi:hypothetical protein D3C86_2017750 [compost metagenome]